MYTHSINDRALTTFKSIEKELQLHTQKNYLFPLSNLSILELVGDNARPFLQGQLTCDISSISQNQMVQGAQCNLKGRILNLMDVFDWNGIKVLLPKDMQESTINSFAKTAILSRVKVQLNSQFFIFGFYLQNPNDIIPNHFSFSDILYSFTSNSAFCSYHLGNGFYIIVTQTDVANELQKPFLDKDQLLGSLTWHTLRLNNYQIDIYPQSRGLFLPHRLDLQKTSYISFNKGCYKGQEIIARMHYKSTLKHHLQINELKTNKTFYIGQKLLNKPDGTEIGEIIDYSILSSDRYLVAISILNEADGTICFSGDNQFIELQNPKIGIISM